MRGKGVFKIDLFLDFFSCAWVLEWVQKLVPIFFIIFGINFGFLFLGSWIFRVSFGSHLGPLEAFWRGLSSQKSLKNLWVFKVFVNEGFWFFEAPDGSFGLILALLGRSDPKLGSKMSFNSFLKSGKNKYVKIIKNKCKFKSFSGVQDSLKMRSPA